MQPCQPVGLQYSGAPQSAEALRLSNPHAPLRFTSRALTQPSASVSNLMSSYCHFLTRAVGRLLHGQEKPAADLGNTPCVPSRNLQQLEILWYLLVVGTASVIGSAFTAHRNCSPGMAPRGHRDRISVPEHHANRHHALVDAIISVVLLIAVQFVCRPGEQCTSPPDCDKAPSHISHVTNRLSPRRLRRTSPRGPDDAAARRCPCDTIDHGFLRSMKSDCVLVHRKL